MFLITRYCAIHSLLGLKLGTARRPYQAAKFSRIYSLETTIIHFVVYFRLFLEWKLANGILCLFLYMRHARDFQHQHSAPIMNLMRHKNDQETT